jgi:hypothetical protein
MHPGQSDQMSLAKYGISLSKQCGLVWFGLIWFMVFNAIFNNISVISWRSVLWVEETGVPGEIHQPVASSSRTSSHNVVSSTPRHEKGSNLHL